MPDMLEVKAGSNAGLHLQYTVLTDEVDECGNCVTEPHDLHDTEIRVDFISPKTGISLASLSTENGGVTILNVDRGTYILDPGDTSDWPICLMPFDVLYMKYETKQASNNFYLNIVKGYTK